MTARTGPRRAPGTGARAAVAFMALAALTLAACAGGGGGDGEPTPPPPMDMGGRSVMLMPARAGAPPELESELVARLTARDPAVEWIRPEEIEATVAANPGSLFELDAPRTLKDTGGGNFRLADPLYGDVRRLGAILDAPLAVIPMATGARTDSLGVTLQLAVVVVTVRGGDVIWRHTVRTEPSGTRSEAAAAAAETLARTLIRSDG